MTSDQPRQPSIRDVARVAGVAHQTVSRVLNDFPSISPETRQKVLAAVSEVGYRPNAAARALVSRRSRTIGVLASSIIHHGPASSIAEIERSALDHGYRLSITSFDETDPTSASRALDFLLSQRVEALAIITPVNAALETVRAAALRIPVIVLEPLELPDVTSLAYDQSQGIRAATRHLIDLGHQRILHVSGPSGSIESDVRTAGFAEEISSAGLPLLNSIEGDWTASRGYAIGLEVLPGHDFTGIVAANDQTAIGVLHACRQLGVNVPDDLSIVGFDDIPEAEHLAPALTTVRQDFAQIGRHAMRLLLDELDQGIPMTPHLLHPELVIRQSTAVPRRL